MIGRSRTRAQRMSFRTEATGREARRRIVCPPDSRNAWTASSSRATMEVAGNVARTHTGLRAVAGAATVALVATVIGLGAVGRYPYLDNYWGYRGVVTPNDHGYV